MDRGRLTPTPVSSVRAMDLVAGGSDRSLQIAAVESAKTVVAWRLIESSVDEGTGRPRREHVTRLRAGLLFARATVSVRHIRLVTEQDVRHEVSSRAFGARGD